MTSAPPSHRPSGPPAQVDVVIVNWHHECWVPSCVASVAAASSATVTVETLTVVDNASSLVSLDAPGGIARTVLLRNGHNAGFARACNQGAQTGQAAFILFLNPDTRIHPDALTHAVAAMRTPDDADVGIVGLQLVGLDGTVQRTSGRFPQLGTTTAQLLGLSRVVPRLCPGFRMTEWDHAATQDVDFACGAALLVRRALFEQLGGFDERLFVYLEDADLSLRARHRGWRTLFCADAVVQHACGWSGGGNRTWRLAQSWRSLLVYAWTHFSRPSAWLLTALLLVAAPLARVGASVVQRTPGQAPDGVRAWFLLLRLLADGLRRETPNVEVAPLRPDAPAPR